MDIREFLQAVAGIFVLQPDKLILQSAAPTSYVLTALGGAFGSHGSVLGAFSVAHTFAMVVGIGLILGIGTSTSLFIGLFVVLGVAEGLFAVGALFGVLGLNSAAIATGVAQALEPTFSHPLVADAYVLFPFVILAVGVGRHRWGSSRAAVRYATASHNSFRHYCSFCGSVVKPGLKRCQVCRKVVPKPSKSFCGTCGRDVPEGAAFCWYCGGEMKWSGGASCVSCGEPVSPGSKFCPHCGSRQPPAATPAQGDAKGR